MTPPIWAGCDLPAWGRLLARNRFAVAPSRWRMAAVVTAASVFNTVLGVVQRVLHGGRVALTPVRQPPVFVLGHWRSGTTLLHELLACDPRHAAPTTYECFAPHHHLVSGAWLPALLGWLRPTRRPMDNVVAGWDRPQEDEFALALLGQPSPYEQIAFPNRTDGVLDLAGLSAHARRRWERVFYRLVQGLTVAHGGRRLVLKSPSHTCRVPTLLRLFPAARLVHIVRDPYAVYPSALHLWRVLSAAHGLQRPSWERLPEHVLATFERMHWAFEDARRLIPSGQLHGLRYEDLVRDPVGQLEALYRDLGLGPFEPARRPVEDYLAARKGYESGSHLLTVEERRTITTRWGAFIRQYGYPVWPG
jgi:hypothetical protein